MTDKQERLYLLFKEIDTICKKHNLRYYMAGGSLIGVVRHRGYVPWDDDMDILMPRDDFNKFVEICKTEAPPNRVVESSDLDRNYSTSLARYIDTSATAIHKNQLGRIDPQGFVIDVLILDPIPDDKKIMMQYKKDIMLYADLINGSTVNSYRFGFNAWRFIYYYLKTKLFGKDKVFKELEDRMFCYNEEDCSKYVMRWGGCCFFFDKDMYGDGKFMKFLDIDVMIPDRYIDYLTWHYGDEWMFIPPHSDQEGHEAIYDLNAESGPIADLVNNIINGKKLNRFYYRRKIFCLLMMKKRHSRTERRTKFKLELKTRNILNILDAHKEEIEQAVADNDIILLSDYLSAYIELQMARTTIGREDYTGIYRFTFPILLDVPTYYTELALECMFCTNRISKAARLIELLEEKGVELSPKISDIKQDIISFRKAVNEFNDGRFDVANKLCDEVLKKHPKSISLLKLKIELLLVENQDNQNNNVISLLIQSAYQLFPTDGDLLKYQADITEDTDNKIEMYLTAVKHTSNGLTHLNILDFCEQNRQRILEQFDYWLKTDKENIKTLISSYLFLFPDDIDILILRNKLVENSYPFPRGIIAAEKSMRSLINKYPDNQEIKSRYFNVLSRMTDDESINDFLYTIHTCNNDVSVLNKCIKEIQSLNNSQFKFIALGNIYAKLGKSDLSTKMYIEAIDCGNSKTAENCIKSYLYSEIALASKHIIFSQKLKFKSKNKNIDKIEQTQKVIDFNIDKIANRLESVFGNYEDALELFKKVNLLEDKHINFIFATLNNESKGFWNKISIRTLNLMLKAYRMEQAEDFNQTRIDEMYEKADRLNHPENYIVIPDIDGASVDDPYDENAIINMDNDDTASHDDNDENSYYSGGAQ